MASARRVRQLGMVVEAADYEYALHFYRDVLGAAEEFQRHGDNGGLTGRSTTKGRRCAAGVRVLVMSDGDLGLLHT